MQWISNDNTHFSSVTCQVKSSKTAEKVYLMKKPPYDATKLSDTASRQVKGMWKS